MDEHIKRSEVVGLIEDKFKRCRTAHEALAFASLRTAVMGLRSADVAPRAEVAREIFWEMDKLLLSITIDEETEESFVGFDFDKYLALKKKYTKPELPKGDHHE